MSVELGICWDLVIQRELKESRRYKELYCCYYDEGNISDGEYEHECRRRS
jgi:hypothetical protein